MFDQPCASYHRNLIAGKCPWCGEEILQAPLPLGIGEAVSRSSQMPPVGKEYWLSILPDLVAALSSHDVQEQLWGLRGLGIAGKTATPYVDAIIKLMSDCSEEVRSECGFTLVQIAPDGDRALSALRTLLADPALRSRAVWHLVHIGSDAKFAMEPLLEIVADEGAADADRGNSAVMLGNIGPKAIGAEPALLRLLEHPSPTIRQFAATALQKIRSPE